MILSLSYHSARWNEVLWEYCEGNIYQEDSKGFRIILLSTFCKQAHLFAFVFFFFMEKKKCWVELHVLSYVIKKSSKGHALVRLGLGSLPTLSQVLGGGGSLRIIMQFLSKC